MILWARLTRLAVAVLFLALGLEIKGWAAANPDTSASDVNPPNNRTNWWSFKQPVRPAIPEVKVAGIKPRNPIDNFIFSKLAELKLTPSPEADRRTLIRRLSFDLIGLPPTPEEVDAFVSDSAPDAYERLVERLLASPRYGEHWARHWLDVVHFGETHGYDKDKLRTNAWPYRDYVIRAFNQDKPYARFVEEQLAGDVLFPDEADSVVALGFIAAGPWDFVGHVELPITKTDGLIARYNDRDDMVMTTLSTFQSLTVHCARCHDHKFDPISQKDYYALQAVFAGVDRANRPYDSDPVAGRQRRQLLSNMHSLKMRRTELDEARAKNTSQELEHVNAELAATRASLGPDLASDPEKKSPSNGYHSKLEPSPHSTKWVQVDLGREVTLESICLVPARPTDFPDTPGFGFPVRFKVELSREPAFAEPELIADHTASDLPNPADVPVALEIKAKPARYIRVTATRLWERTKDYAFALGELQAFGAGTNVARASVVTALDSIEAGRWSRAALVDGYSSRGPLSDTQPSTAQLARSRTLASDILRLSAERERILDGLFDPALKTELASAVAELALAEQKLGALPAPELVYAAANTFAAEGNFLPPSNGARVVHLLARGDVNRPREEMSAAGLPAVPGPPSKFELAPTEGEAARRAALAKWITDPRNLLTRRSIVNRVWQYHFGKGIVDSPNDFGHMGSLPTHPELLDWLAFWFLENGESLKKLHQLLVTSATYRQTSAINSQGSRLDAENRFLWRMNRVRLDAECIRDTMLLVSGGLDLRMGGPSDRQFVFKDDHSPVYDYVSFDPDSPTARRRSIYRHVVRSVPDPFMDCLDAADPSQLVAKRYATLTALQALATLNDPFVLAQCRHFAERLSKMSEHLEVQIAGACRLAWSRNPSPDESRLLSAYARQHGLANLCRVIFNSSEFVFVD